MSDHKNVILGMLIIAGAYFYTRRAAGALSGTGPTNGMVYRPTQGNPTQPLGVGSMPGSVGTGAAQALGGLIGNLFSPQTGGGTSTGAPPPNSSQDYSADYILQNNVPAADPQQSFDPTAGSSNIGGALFDNMQVPAYA